MAVRFLVAESETADARAARVASVGQTAAESYVETLRSIVPGAECDIVRPHEAGAGAVLPRNLREYDAVFLSGSPLHVYDESPETRRQLDFMRAVFAANVPSFGSCAGLQVAAAAAGGRVGRAARHELGFARRISATAAGVGHPLLAGRPVCWDALAIHSDRVEALPPGGTLLAGNAVCPVQAVEIRMSGGVFWGVQYHPELEIREIAASLRRQASDVVAQGAARNPAEVDAQAALIDALGREPGRQDLAWRLGVDQELTESVRRRRELANFIGHFVTG